MRSRLLPAVLSLCLALPALADLTVPRTSSSVIVIPAAGDAAGANGTYFRSDITVVNLRDAEQTVLFRWLPQGRSGDAAGVRTLTMAPRSGLTSEDFVRNILQQTGLGAIEIVGVTPEGGVDPAAALHASARIWSPTPNGAGGTMSQTFPAIIPEGSTTVPVKWVLGARRDERYRMNAGIANTSSLTQRFRVIVISNTSSVPGEQIEIELPPLSMQQVLMPGTSGVGQVIFQNVSAQQSAPWHAWVSSVDNESGDAWSLMAFPAPPVAP